MKKWKNKKFPVFYMLYRILQIITFKKSNAQYVEMDNDKYSLSSLRIYGKLVFTIFTLKKLHL
jgi:hypothetical protein